MSAARSSRLVIRIGSTTLMRNGSMMVLTAASGRAALCYAE
jgi:hypothetical protein